jgi:hypothetical protein
MIAAIANIDARRPWLLAIRPLPQSAVASMLEVDPAHGVKVKAPKTRSHHTRIDEGIASHRAFGRWGRNSALLGFALEAVSCRTAV